MSTQVQLVRYARLVQVLADLARSGGVDDVIKTVHRQAGTLFPAQVTLLALLESQAHQAHQHQGHQLQGHWRWEMYEGDQHFTQRLPYYPDGVLEQVLAAGALFIPDIDTYLDTHPRRARRLLNTEEVIPDIRAQAAKGQPTLSMLFVPLEVQQVRVGVLSMQSYAVGAFDVTDLQFLELLGQHVSIALENAALREALERATLTDPLTGLPNRRAFMRRAREALGAAQPAEQAPTLVMLDVQDFKRVNDSFGHPTGDQVLTTIGEVLAAALPAADGAFRLGGDEFALLLRGGAARLPDLAARVTAGLRAAVWPQDLGPVCLQGGAAQPPPEGSLQEWLSLADARMYAAKRQQAASAERRWGLHFMGSPDDPALAPCDGPERT